jgi:YD repeat-containing protein
MNLKYSLTLKEYLESQLAYRTRLAKNRILFRNLYLLALLGVALATLFLLSGVRWLAIILLAAALALLLHRTLFWRLKMKRSNDEAARPQEIIELNIGNDSLIWERSSDRGEVRWPNVDACHETRNLLLLEISGAEVLAIPKRVFPPGDYSRFRDLLRKELIIKITRESSDTLLLKFAVTWGLGALVVMTLSLGYVSNFLNELPGTKRPYRRAPVVPAKSAPALLEHLRGAGAVYVVPIGPISSVPDINPLIQEYSSKYKVAMELLPGIPLPSWAENQARKQYVAEDLISAIQLAYPKLAAAPQAVIIGVTDADMYISENTWTYAFSFRDEERFAVISTAHLSEDDDGKAQGSDVTEKRLRKVLARDLGILYFRLQPTQNYNSLLYQSVGDATELDELADGYLESDAQVRADLHIQDGDPCFVLRQYEQPERVHPVAGSIRECSGAYRERDLETVEIDLRYGLLLDQRTDFLNDDRIPLQLTRVLRTQDSQARAFGMGGNHNLNIFLVGDRWPFTWMDLILATGGRAHYGRSNWGVGYWDAHYQNRDRGWNEYSYSTIQWAWPGWRLEKGGDVYRFPASADAQRAEQAALIAIERRNGEKLSLIRDREGNLLRAVSPERHELRFTYDSANRITKIQDPLQPANQFLYEYDARGHLLRVTDNNGRITEYGYDSYGRMISIQQDGARLCAFEYERMDRVRRETLADGRVYDFQYDLGNDGQIFAVDIKDSAGPTRRIRMFAGDYSLETTGDR